jgi:hypothetical protein
MAAPPAAISNSSSACTNWAITGTRFPLTDASSIIPRR